MRTTITLNDDLYREVKTRAAQQGCTVGSVIEDAIRGLVTRSAVGESTLPDLPTYSGGSVRPGLDLSDTSALMDLLDEGVGVDAVR